MASDRGRARHRCEVGSEEFLRGLHARRPEALTALAEAAGPRILGRIRSLVSDEEDAKDLYQDCWLHLMKRLDKCTKPDTVLGWAVVTTANHCKSLLRRRGRATAPVFVALGDAGDLADAGPDPARELERSTVKRTVSAALECLPERQREAVTLTLMEGRSNAEAAMAMHVSRRTISSLVAAAVRKLQERPELRQCFQDMCR